MHVFMTNTINTINTINMTNIIKNTILNIKN
ncbi:hypothetical protein PFFCH_02620 [Plasmodium falciparum FCH/4]|uniref:Uncharacterized protein n=1 Tax=Plasmodium falciparum FCH/4 TaxID=1036724 RepID=A0A024VP35_PLAFA|nr:hypothetical protein PFFCH_02620 [Plasmodium falciparum FCH/4]